MKTSTQTIFQLLFWLIGMFVGYVLTGSVFIGGLLGALAGLLLVVYNFYRAI